MKAYYEFLEIQGNPSPNTQSTVFQAKNLLNLKDIDTTIDSFIQYYINDFLPYFPHDVVLDERKLIKIARQFYVQKGTPQSIQFLFQVLYGKQADIYFPKNNILRCSDGKWTQPQALRLLLDTQNLDFPVQQLVQRIGIGSNSGAQCVIESVNKTVDPNLGFEIVEVYVSNITKPFDDLESLQIAYGVDANGNPLVFEEKIIAALSNIVIDPHNQGLLYVTGDPVVLTGGLQQNDPAAQKAIAFVGNVTTGSVTAINVAFGGFDYRQNPNTIVTFVNDPKDANGAGAQAIVSSIDTANAIHVLVNTDCLEFHANVVLGSPGAANQWGFNNCAFTNANTPMGLALSYANLEFAPILTMNVTNGGGGYSRVPTVDMEVVYYTDLTDTLIEAGDPAANSTFQNIDDLGMFAAVRVLNGGKNYSNVTDKIYTNTAIGYDAAFDFVTGAGGAITSVIITNKGCGYIGLPNIGLYLANSTNSHNVSAGSNASLVPFGFGQGANLQLSVSQIGQIVDFDLVNRGFDYVDAPIVSLRIQDVIINALDVNQVPANDLVIFQGANASVATYRAFVDSLNPANNVLRLYNYRGGLNLFSNLVMTLTNGELLNVTVNTAASHPVTTYGNGLAKANAIFLNGLIQFPGFWLNTDGFLSSDQYIEDSETYHNYSYQIIVEKALAEYKNVLMQIAHPAGMSMLGIYVIPATASQFPAPSSNIAYISPLTGSINVFPYGLTVQGHATSWATDGVQAGDLLVFGTGPTEQALIIANVASDTLLNVEAKGFHQYSGTANVGNVAAILTTSNSDLVGNVTIGDGVIIGLPGNAATFNVTTVTPNQLIFDGLVGVGANNIQIAFVKNYVNASYQIVSSQAR